MAYGWISLHRKIQENDLWLDPEPFDRRSAWIDLILLANHEDKKVIFDGGVVEVKRGSKITSLRKLSKKWKWSTTKVKKFLELLKDLDMIDYKSDTKKTVYTICNYNVYQNEDIDKRNTEITQKRHRNNTEITQKKTNNNDNNINNVNNDNNIVSKPDPIPYKEIIDYLNQKSGKTYKSSAYKNQSLIKARWNEGNRVEDFKKVIDNKASEWLADEKMNKYLRPSTLFGKKFDEYRNQDVDTSANNRRSRRSIGDDYESFAEKARKERIEKQKKAREEMEFAQKVKRHREKEMERLRKGEINE